MADQEYLDRNDIYSAAVNNPPQEEGATLKSVLVDMGKFALGMAVLGGVSKIAGRSVYKSLVKKNDAFANSIAKNLGKTTVTQAEQAMNLGSLSRGVRQTLADNPAGVFNLTTDNSKRMMQVLSGASKASIFTGAFGRGAYSRLASSKYIGVRAAAGAARQFYKSAPVAAGFYGISRALGIGDQTNQPAWYNIPGHAKAIIKTTAEFASFDIGMGGVKRLGKFAKNVAAKTLNSEKAPALNAFLDRNFAITRTKDGPKAGSFLEKAVKALAVFDGLREGSKTVGSRVTDAFMTSWGNKASRDAQKSAIFDSTSSRFYKETLNEGIAAGRKAYKSRVQSLKTFRSDGAYTALSEMNDFLAKQHNIDGKVLAESLRKGDTSLLKSPAVFSNPSLIGTSILDAMKDNLDKHSLKAVAESTMGGQILKRQLATGADILTGADRTHGDMIFQGLKDLTYNVNGRKAVDALEESFYKMSSRNVFKSTNSVVDYSMYNPRNLASSFLNFVNPYFVVGTFGRELPLVKTLGLQKYLAKEGMGLHTIRADEGQIYYDTALRRKSIVGDEMKGATHRAGGAVVDGELFVTNSQGILVKANAARQTMDYSTPYARDSVLYKINAQAGTSSETFDNILAIEGVNKKRSMFDRYSDFTSRWGLKTPSPIQWMMEGLNKTFGFMPMNVGVKEFVNKMLDPRSTMHALKGDMNAIIDSVGYMSNESSAALYQTLSHPRMWDHMGRLAKQVGHGFEERAMELKTVFKGTDEEVMNIIRNRGSFRDDETMKYALEHYTKFGNYGLNEQVSTKFSMRRRPLTRREELNRKLLNETMGGQGLPTLNAESSAFNFASRMLQDNEVLSLLSKEEVKHLKMTATGIDLFHSGFLDGSGRVAANYGEKAKGDALNIIRTHLKDEEQYLQKRMFDTPMIADIGVLGFGRKNAEAMSAGEFYAKRVLNEQRKKFNSSPFIMREESGGLGSLGFQANSFIDRVMDMGNHIGLKYSVADRSPKTWKMPNFVSRIPYIGTKFGGASVTLGGPLSSMMKRVGQGVGILAAAQAADAFTTDVPLFNGTMLDNGIFSAAADVYVKANMGFHKVKDLSGITDAAKYLEGLMPSSTSTIPGAMIGGFMKGPLGIIPGAVINRFMDANSILPNFDKSYDEMKDTYSGRELVPVRRNRFWLFSKSPYEGDGPAYYRPHWYPRLKSQYKYTDTLYGSKSEAFLYAPWSGLGFNTIGHVLDKYHYERKHYWDRPYPVSAPAFSEVPILGDILGATVGRLPIIGKPLKHMHEDEMSHYYSTNGSNTAGDGELSTSKMPNVSQTEQYAFMRDKGNLNSESALYGSMDPKRLNPYGAMTVLGEQLYNFTELAGLKGYQLESFMGGGLADERPRLNTASDMWSARRAFWDLNAGDIFGSCFIEGTKVITDNGRKPIEDIQIGDDIITIDGSIKKVIGKLKKEQQSNIYELKCSTVDVIVNVTEKHHFPIYKRYPCHNQNQRPCVPGNKKHCKICTKIDKNITIYDIAVENINKGDFLCLPIIQPSQQNILLNGKIITPDIAYFLGWYVAEGCCEKYRITMSMNINEIEYANHLAKIIRDNFGKNVQIYTREKDSKLSLIFSDKNLALELKILFGHGAKNKYIPYKIKTLPIYILKEFFKGCVLGDGFCNLKTAGFTSASSDLCRDLFDIGLSLGFIGHLVIDYHEKGKGIMPQGTPRKDSIRSYISWNQVSVQIYNLVYGKNEDVKILKKNSKSFIYDNKLFVQVKSNTKVSIVSDVYDLEIEEKHYYMVEHIVTHNTEFFRRFVPKEKKTWQKVNPLRNKMASWLPSQEGDYFVDFLTGDPYTKIQEGEMRLPGDAYNKLYDVKRTFPGRSSSLGKDVESLVKSLTGLTSTTDVAQEEILEEGTETHRYVQDTLIRNNIGIKAEQFVYDVKNDISGHIDLIMHDMTGKSRSGRRLLEIKTISGKGFNKLSQPKKEHHSQLNFYLRQMQEEIGTFLYINRDDPTQIRTFDIRYNEERFRKDLADLQFARKAAAKIMANGDGFETGSGYSHLDRLRILADVAPYSKQFKEEENIVALQLKEGMLSEQDKEEIVKIKKHRRSVMRKYDMYPTRFKGRVFDPDTNYQLMSENNNIKAAAEYGTGARMLGSAWERLMQMDTPLNTKLWNYKSPLGHYESTRIYGTESAAWNQPYNDLIKPMFTKALATDNPMNAAASFGWIGALGLGGMGNMMLPGAAFGGMYGAARTVVGNDGWIPGEVQKKREIEQTFDRLKYERAKYLYDMTGNAMYQTEADNTLWNISQKGYQVGVAQSMKAMSSFEKPYYLSWMQETNPIERQNILDMVPEDIGNMLRVKWGMSATLPEPSKYEVMIPNSDWEGLLPNENLSDIKVRTIDQAGLRATDFGLGWYDQQRRISNSRFELNPVGDKQEVLMANNIASRVKASLTRLLSQYCRRPLISVSVSPSGPDGARVQLNLMRNRFEDIREAMRVK